MKIIRNIGRLAPLILVGFLGFLPQRAQAQRDICRHGLFYSPTLISEWGAGSPVVKAVTPWSPADKAGLSSGDILESIDGVSTRQLSRAQIDQLLEQEPKRHLLQILRPSGERFKVILSGACKRDDVLNERELAELMPAYSMSDVNLEHISYPFSYSSTTPNLLEGVKTFSFAPPPSSANEALELEINQAIARALIAKGLKQSEGADLIVRTFYELTPKGEGAPASSAPFSWRYSTETSGFEAMNLLGEGAPASLISYTLSFGITLERPGRTVNSWTVEAKESLSDAIPLSEYVRKMVGMMLAPLPSTPPAQLQKYTIRTLRYHYTGLSFWEHDLGRVADVAYASPAFVSGLRPGDRIKAINGIPLGQVGADKIYEAYQAFIEASEHYLEPDLSAYAPEGGRISLRSWREKYYGELSNLITRGRTAQPFAYIFGFRTYILPESNGQYVFTIERKGIEYSVLVTPEMRDETTICPE